MQLTNIIRLGLKKQYDSVYSNKLRRNILNAIPFWTGALLTGLAAVFYAKLFLWTEEGAAYVFHGRGWLLFIITPACFFTSYWLVNRFAPYSRGSGIPQVSAAIELTNPKHHYKVNRLLSLRIIFVKISATLAMVFGGGVIGREGPTIQIAASIFKKINDALPAWYPKISKRNMIITGAASGLAAAFNTPLGGIVFTIEELTKTHFNFYKSAIFTGVVIAGLTALTLFGPYLYLGYPLIDKISPWMLLTVIPVALVAGLTGSGTAQLILILMRWKGSLSKRTGQIIFLLTCSLVVAAMGYFFGLSAIGSGKETMTTALFTDHKYSEWYMPLCRIVGPVVSFSTGVSGGIFAPALSAGASIGAFVSGIFHLTAPDTNLLILCGMAAFLTGVTRSPFTSAILVIEMTNSHNIIFYLMITTLVANLFSTLVSKHSFYDYLKAGYLHEIHMTEKQETDKG